MRRGVRPIIVLGPERSGTSAWAEMIAAWGAYPGGKADLPPPDTLNPRGRWEYQPLWPVLEKIGDFSLGVSWWEESFPQLVAAKAANPQLVTMARRLIGQMEQPGTPWVWKDPALCHFLPFWRTIWDDPLYVIAVRNPVDVAKSWQRFARLNDRAPTSVACNLLRWQHMLLSVLCEAQSARACVFAEYEALVADPYDQARRLAASLDQHCGKQTGKSRIAAMAAACDPALWRHRDGTAIAHAHMTSAQNALYEFLRARATGRNLPFTDRYPMPDGWRSLILKEEAAAIG